MAHHQKKCNVGSYRNLTREIHTVGKPHGNKPCGIQDINDKIILK
jgi:hypothetical protein